MTDDHKPVPPKPAEHKAPAKKTTRPAAPKAAPRPAPRSPMIPSVTFKPEAPQSKGKIAAAVATTVGAIGMVGYSLARVAGKMLGRGR